VSKSLFKAAFTVGAGALFEAGDWLKQQVAEWEAEQDEPRALVIVPAEQDGQQSGQVAANLARGAARATGRGVRTTRRVAGAAGSLTAASLNAVAHSRPLAPFAPPLRRELAGLERRAAAQVENWGRAGQVEIDRSRALAREVFGRGVSAVAAYLSENPGVHGLIQHQIERIHHDQTFQAQINLLVRSLVGNYLVYLQEDPDEIDALVRERVAVYLAHLEEEPRLVEALVRAQANAYVDYLAENPAHVEALIRSQADSYLLYLLDDSQLVEALVRGQANAYVDYLAENPAQVEALIRVQADNYIDHLSDNPEQVQDLVRGQSAGLANEVTNEMRGRLTTADSALETVLRRMLKRTARADLPEPPPEVQALAGPRQVGTRE